MSTGAAQEASAATAEARTLTDQQLEICHEFIGACFDRLRGNLEMLLGHALAFSLQDVIVEGDASIRVRMPVTGAACGMRSSLDGGISLLMIEPPLTHTLLALCRMAPEEEVTRLRTDGGALTPEDRKDLEEVANFQAAAFADESKSRTQGRVEFESTGVLSIEDSTWTAGADPLEAVPYVTLTGTVKVGDTNAEDPFHLFIPQACMGSILPAFAEGGEDAAAASPAAPAAAAPAAPPPQPAVRPPEPRPLALDGAGILCLVPESAAAALEAALPGKTTCVTRPSMLLQVLEETPGPDLLLARVGAGQGHVLRLLSAVRRHPSLAGCPILLLLEEATPRQVVRCGQLGLWDVLPATARPEVLQRRVQELLASRQGQ